MSAAQVSAASAAIWQVVSAIPRGRVATYGQVAGLAGQPRGARQVGRALGLAPAALGLPWYRVLAAGGRIALPAGSASRRTQIARLRAEGVVVTNGRVPMARYQWAPSLDELLWGPPPGGEGEEE
jgi:methylated-DNA-protein-cysteine methyltransferase-like protein